MIGNIVLILCALVIFAIVIIPINDHFYIKKYFDKINESNRNKEFLKSLVEYTIDEREYYHYWTNKKTIGFILTNDFGLKIDFTVENGRFSKIYIDDILVLKFNYDWIEWKHNVPKEMKKYIENELLYIKKEYKKYQQRLENESKMTYNEEEQYLIKKFGVTSNFTSKYDRN